MATLTITKLANGNVEITGGTSAYTLLPTMNVFRDKSTAIDGVQLVSDGIVKDTIKAADVVALAGGSGPIVSPTGDQLYAELKDYFFNA